MKRIILTTGPSFLHGGIIKKMHKKRYIYRINGSHGTLKDLEYTIEEVRKQVKNAEILIDLPGNKIRTANLLDNIQLVQGKPFFLKYEQTNFPDVYRYLKKGDAVYAADGAFTFEISEIKDGYIKLMSHSDGELSNNKGIHVRGLNAKLPFLFEKDVEIIKLINKYKIRYVGLSFVRNVSDVEEARSKIKSAEIICKIETRQAVDNLGKILNKVENVLIDRGDLSADVGLANIAYFQRFIIERALLKNKRVFLATQFLKSMETQPIPSIAEVIDLTHTLKNGVHGIQLSEEMAIGKYPQRCLDLIHEIEKSINSETV